MQLTEKSEVNRGCPHCPPHFESATAALLLKLAVGGHFLLLKDAALHCFVQTVQFVVIISCFVCRM